MTIKLKATMRYEHVQPNDGWSLVGQGYFHYIPEPLHVCEPALREDDILLFRVKIEHRYGRLHLLGT